ncbi:hypothetical protein DFJ77DRAFT_455294 [Powellomyces hirtus]|nr:hypothetical protein DFJ77DRAFT_455294 [Powellomyces hirtus]
MYKIQRCGGVGFMVILRGFFFGFFFCSPLSLVVVFLLLASKHALHLVIRISNPVHFVFMVSFISISIPRGEPRQSRLFALVVVVMLLSAIAMTVLFFKFMLVFHFVCAVFLVLILVLVVALLLGQKPVTQQSQLAVGDARPRGIRQHAADGALPFAQVAQQVAHVPRVDPVQQRRERVGARRADHQRGGRVRGGRRAGRIRMALLMRGQARPQRRDARVEIDGVRRKHGRGRRRVRAVDEQPDVGRTCVAPVVRRELPQLFDQVAAGRGRRVEQRGGGGGQRVRLHACVCVCVGVCVCGRNRGRGGGANNLRFFFYTRRQHPHCTLFTHPLLPARLGCVRFEMEYTQTQ